MNEMDRLKKAFAPASDEFRRHMETTLDNMEDLTMKKTPRRVSALAVALIILLIAGVALAAAHFGVMEFITYRDQEGNPLVNETLIGHVQPIGETLTGNAASVTVLDAICDGASLSLAWTAQNTLPDEDVYVFWHLMLEDDMSYRAGDYTPNEFILGSGQTREGGLTASLVPFAEGDTLRVNVYFTILAAERDIEFLHDSVQLPYELYEPDESKTDALVRLGYMRQLDDFTIPLELDITSKMMDILDQADKTEVDIDGYRVTLSSIVVSPTTLRYTIDYQFDSETRMNTFMQERGPMGLWPMDNDDETWFGFGETYTEDLPEEADNQWTVRYVCDIAEIWKMPDTIDIIPYDTRTHEPYHPDEKFHVSIPKP